MEFYFADHISGAYLPPKHLYGLFHRLCRNRTNGHPETMLRNIAAAIFGAMLLSTPAQAFNTGMKASLMKLDPVTRLEQRCDVAVMETIRHDQNSFNPDRVVAYTFEEPNVDGDEISSHGAAFRSKGHWYRLAFSCKTAPDHIEVLALEYKVGDEIPRDDWKRLNLWK